MNIIFTLIHRWCLPGHLGCISLHGHQKASRLTGQGILNEATWHVVPSPVNDGLLEGNGQGFEIQPPNQPNYGSLYVTKWVLQGEVNSKMRATFWGPETFSKTLTKVLGEREQIQDTHPLPLLLQPNLAATLPYSNQMRYFCLQSEKEQLEFMFLIGPRE